MLAQCPHPGAVTRLAGALGFLPWVLEVVWYAVYRLRLGLTRFLCLESPLDSHSWHHRWRICCSRHLLLKWLQLQALHQEGQLAPERRVIPQPSFLPFCLSFLAFLQAVLRAISFIR